MRAFSLFTDPDCSGELIYLIYLICPPQKTCLVDEGGGHSRLPASAGTANPVNVVLDLVRHVEVDDVLDVRKVQSLRRDVRRNEDVLCSVLPTA